MRTPMSVLACVLSMLGISSLADPISISDGTAGFLIGGNAIIVDPALVSSGDPLTGFTVSINTGFTAGDTLAFTGTPPSGVTGSYNASTGVLTFVGAAPAASWQTLLRTVTFATTSNTTGQRTIVFTAGGVIPFEGNGHYYKYVASVGTWPQALTAASNTTLFGLQGYLATITSQAENDFIRLKLAADAWVGGSDATVEGAWRWVTGPEAGTQFWSGGPVGSGGVAVGGRFANWNAPQPDDSANEDCLEIYLSDGVGRWNDLPNTYILNGYVVEFGGMPGDATPVFSDSRTVAIAYAPSLYTLHLSEVTADTAKCGGHALDDGGAPVTARGVCWSTTSNPTIADGKTVDGTGTGMFYSNMTGLRPGTLYHVRAYASNAAATAYGEEDQCTTLTRVPLVTTSAITDAEFANATGGGLVVDEGGLTVTARGLCWNTTGSPTLDDTTTNDGTGEGAFTSAIRGLFEQTTYYVRAYATNSLGTAYGSEVVFTTPSIIASLPDLRVLIASSTSTAHVGDSLDFEVRVQNAGPGKASNVKLRVALPAGTEFVSAALAAVPAAQAAPLNATVEGSDVVIELGDVAVGEDIQISLVLKVLVTGAVTLTASAEATELTTPAAGQADTSIDVDDAYYEIIHGFPVRACGPLQLITPLTISAGLLTMKRRRSWR